MDTWIRYDGSFIQNCETLKDLLEEEEWQKLYAFLIKEFGVVFRRQQRCWREAGEGTAQAYDLAGEEIRRELARPLSHRQYRMVERAFSPWKHEEDDVLWSVWNFLDDEGRIVRKKVMSMAEIAGFSMIYEQACVCLTHKTAEPALSDDPEQIERITYYEALFDKAEDVIASLGEDCRRLSEMHGVFRELEQYYIGEEWRHDYEDDEAGKIPKNLRRGVLSEDGLYNLLREKNRWEEILKEINEE